MPAPAALDLRLRALARLWGPGPAPWSSARGGGASPRACRCLWPPAARCVTARPRLVSITGFSRTATREPPFPLVPPPPPRSAALESGAGRLRPARVRIEANSGAIVRPRDSWSLRARAGSARCGAGPRGGQGKGAGARAAPAGNQNWSGEAGGAEAARSVRACTHLSAPSLSSRLFVLSVKDQAIRSGREGGGGGAGRQRTRQGQGRWGGGRLRQRAGRRAQLVLVGGLVGGRTQGAEGGRGGGSLVGCLKTTPGGKLRGEGRGGGGGEEWARAIQRCGRGGGGVGGRRLFK